MSLRLYRDRSSKTFTVLHFLKDMQNEQNKSWDGEL